jgi:hypothetical protein
MVVYAFAGAAFLGAAAFLVAGFFAGAAFYTHGY